jgi:hypothetical protein
MYRLAYRNFSDHESLVANHSVKVGGGNGARGGGGTAGIRWYELRNPNGTPVVFQQGTFSPDSTYRWMGSIAMDHMGTSHSGTALRAVLSIPKFAIRAARLPTQSVRFRQKRSCSPVLALSSAG